MNGANCIAALKALGEPNRMRIMRLLLNEQLGCTTIATRLGISQYNASKHLRILREAGLLAVEPSGKQRLYRVVPRWKHPLEADRDILDLDCCQFHFDRLAQ